MTTPGTATQVLRGTFIRYTDATHGRVRLNQRKGAASYVNARITVPGTIVPDTTVYLAAEDVRSSQFLIVGALEFDTSTTGYDSGDFS